MVFKLGFRFRAVFLPSEWTVDYSPCFWGGHHGGHLGCWLQGLRGTVMGPQFNNLLYVWVLMWSKFGFSFWVVSDWFHKWMWWNGIFYFFILFYYYLCVWVYACVSLPVCAHGCRCLQRPEGVLDILELQLCEVVGYQTWVLGIEPWLSTRAANALEQWVTSPAPEHVQV